MKTLLFSLLVLLAGQVGAQIPSTGALGTYAVGEEAISFTNPSLNSPNVLTQTWYPATTAGTGQPLAVGQFSVIAFGHGFNLNYQDYEIICKHLASWGYIVIAPDVQNGFNVDHQEFARELVACIDEVRAQGLDSTSLFFDHVGTKSGVTGHSMGGGASFLVPSVFPNIDAVCGLAAAETNPSSIAALQGLNTPFMVISGSEDNTAPEASNQFPMYNAVAGEKISISITGGAHCKFTDASTICDLVSSAGSVTRTWQIYETNKYQTAFFNYYLKNDVQALPFLCGDSVAADVSASHVVHQTTLTACAVGLADATSSVEPLVFYPNPAGNLVKVALPESFKKLEIELHDLNGKRIRSWRVSEASSEMELSLDGIPSGAYLLEKQLLIHQ